MEDLLKKSVRLTVIIVLIISVVLVMMRQWRFALGLLVGSAWSITNFFLLIKILEIAMLHGPAKKLSLILTAKFPLLYLIGFLILISRAFPVYSLLAGLGSILLVAGVVGLWPQRI